VILPASFENRGKLPPNRLHTGRRGLERSICDYQIHPLSTGRANSAGEQLRARSCGRAHPSGKPAEEDQNRKETAPTRRVRPSVFQSTLASPRCSAATSSQPWEVHLNA
jgi:hypothetical protein